MSYFATLCFAVLAFLRLPALLAAPTLMLRFQVAGLFLSAFLCLLRRSVAAGGRSEDHGSAGFAGTDELAPLLLKKGASLAAGSVLLGQHEASGQLLALPLALARQHGIIVGGSGTGKSFSFFLPNVTFAHDTSCVMSDPKSELWTHSSGYHFRATRFAPTNPEQSVCFNWVPLCSDARIAELCARAIVEGNGGTEKQEAPWPDLESAFLAALFAHTATLPVPTPLSAYHLFTRQEPARLMEMFLNSPSPVAREQAIIFGQTHERMRGSIVPVVAAKLQFLRDPQVARFCSASFAPPDLSRLRMCPEAVFWCVPEHDIARLRPLTSLFFTLLFEQLATATTAQEGQGIPVLCLLDEFANLGVVPNYDAVISLSRGRGVALWHGVQSLSQLSARYGKDNAQTILTNCATKIALHGLDVETAEYFSRALGPKTQCAPRRSWQGRRFSLFASGVSDTVAEHARPLRTADEIRRLSTNEALVVTGNCRPLLLAKYRYAHTPKTASVGVLGLARCQIFSPDEATPTKAEKLSVPPPLPKGLRQTSPSKKREIGGAETARRTAWRTTPPKPCSVVASSFVVLSGATAEEAASKETAPEDATLGDTAPQPHRASERPWHIE